MTFPTSKRVLVTYAWCRTAYIAVRSLAKAGCEVFVSDHRRGAMCRYSRFSNGFFLSPSSDRPEAYVEAIVSWCSQNAIDTIFPSHEDSLIFREFEALIPSSIHIACPSYGNLLMTLDKAEFSKQMLKAGVSIPKTFFFDSIDALNKTSFDSGCRYVIKTRRGNGGKGVFFVDDARMIKSEFSRVSNRMLADGEGLPIVQERIDGQLYGGCFIAYEGRVLYSFVELYTAFKAEFGGTSVRRVLVENQAIQAEIVKICSALSWSGIGHVDFIRNDYSGAVYAIEFNPRLWGGVGLSYRLGFNAPLAQLIASRGGGESDLVRCVDINRNVAGSRWLLGELIRVYSGLKSGRMKIIWELIMDIWSNRRRVGADDLFVDDILPFVAQMKDYWSEYRSSGGSINPGGFLDEI